MPFVHRSFTRLVALFATLFSTPPRAISVADASIVVRCSDDTCVELILDGRGSRGGRHAEYTWFRDMQELPNTHNKRSLRIPAFELETGSFQLRVANGVGYSWVEVTGLPTSRSVVTPIPIITVKDGDCAAATMVFTPSAGVGGCLTDMAAVGLTWNITGPGGLRTGQSLLLPDVSFVGVMEDGFVTYPSGTPADWFASWRVGSNPIVDTPSPTHPGWTTPAAITHPDFGFGSDFFANWIYGEPGDTFVGVWKGTPAGTTAPTPWALYNGLAVLPDEHSPHFRMHCPIGMDSVEPTEFNPNLPIVTILPASTDIDGDGYVGAFDCNEFDPDTNQGATELLCDGIDSDCDGLDQITDDADGDGSLDLACDPNGDCDDNDPLVGPDLPEVAGNDTDDDCDGLVDEACIPSIHDHIVIPGDDLAMVVSAALVDDIVCIESGDYGAIEVDERLHILGAPGSEVTLAGGGSSVVTITGAGDGTQIENLQLENGEASRGGGMYVAGADVTLRDVTFFQNGATQDGGGLWIDGGMVVGDNVRFEDNIAHRGGGVYVGENASLVLSDSALVGNVAQYGGGAVATATGELVAHRVEAFNNVASVDGGAFFLDEQSTATMEEVTAHNNFAESGRGGAISWSGHALNLSWSTLLDNSAATAGGALHLVPAVGHTPVLSQLLVADNTVMVAGGDGPGIALLDANDVPASTMVELDTVWLWDNAVAGGFLGMPLTSPQPRFVGFHKNLAGEHVDTHLRMPLPTVLWGASFGPLADPTWYENTEVGVDADNLWDGLEMEHVGNLLQGDLDDLDLDGRTNLEEAQLGTLIHEADSDGDGVDDATEFANGTDALDPDEF